MKIRESGMPEAASWDSYFDPELILGKLGLTCSCNKLVEFGCGYGTFTVTAARRVSGTVYALDIDASMIEAARRRAESLGINNIEFSLRDFMQDGTGLPSQSVDYAMLFNILHTEQPVQLMREACRNLKDGGRVGIIHWNYDPETPRGPPMRIRPRPEQCIQWAQEAGFVDPGDIIELPPYHYGLTLYRPAQHSNRH